MLGARGGSNENNDLLYQLAPPTNAIPSDGVCGALIVLYGEGLAIDVRIWVLQVLTKFRPHLPELCIGLESGCNFVGQSGLNALHILLIIGADLKTFQVPHKVS